tara:strand:+ start:815 stop:1357 length:543 start_codon:yes stop_codon:yes gene_type:complete
MAFENMSIWCWLIPILIGIICGILGYFLGKGNSKGSNNASDIQIWKDKNAKLTAELDDCSAKVAASAIVAPAAKTPTVTVLAFNAGAAKAIIGKKIKQDDLKVVEGIGPKIEGLFHSFDIKTWQALSDVSVAKCQEVLNSGGDRYRIHDPSSWPMQAKMCYEGKWEDLKRWQDKHKHGKL